MKMRDQCLPCLIHQVVKVAHMTNIENKEELYQKVFHYLSQLDFQQTNPEIIGGTFRLLKQHTGNEDPYKEIRNQYNELFLKKIDYFQDRIQTIDDAIKYAIVGNMIDFSPMHLNTKDMMKEFEHISDLSLTINHLSQLMDDLKNAHFLLYLGDNCGEICLDRLLIQKIKELFPHLHIEFAVRGSAVVNDSIAEDAYYVGMDRYATIISNGDDCLGTILHRVSPEFLESYQRADVIIAKGQANYESLSEEKKNIYYLLMVKCAVIAADIGILEKSLVCLNKRYLSEN